MYNKERNITAESRAHDDVILKDVITHSWLNLPHMQEAWIQHATVKENILFGQPFDSEKYNAVVFACALEKVRDRGPKIPRMVVVGGRGGGAFDTTRVSSVVHGYK